jgi:glycerol-3-phosphate acyltransferase PlsX
VDAAFRAAAALVLPHLAALRDRFDPEAYGGAHLVGTRGTVVIAHGSSSRVAIANALVLAAEGASRGMVEQIERGMDRG